MMLSNTARIWAAERGVDQDGGLQLAIHGLQMLNIEHEFGPPTGIITSIFCSHKPHTFSPSHQTISLDLP